ncbi:dihydrofolate reductase [Larkinella terrae]|uniref:Dihydrofolate reductase n=1 Tax=Larkinella terrae TaxID=2025311 RepID=A0A7K0ER55_9BACT|nr:dihydrofolate reductase [Larkinella terrae]MRS64287.1 dihydrofolate reductase [Larkinella terrae]
MLISLIAAVAENGVIGQDNELVWHLPDDFKYFKQTTSGHPVLMGRKTFESLGKPLPNRLNVVITRNPAFHPEGAVIVDSLEKAMEEARKTGIAEAFVIGGAEIYRQAIASADRLYLTEVKASYEGDAKFPDFDKTVWQEISRRPHPADDRHAVPFDFVIWERKP